MLSEYFYNLATDKAKGIYAAFFKFILFLISLIYALLVAITRFLYNLNILKGAHLNCRVISIGNITWGGTGKTPIVEMVAGVLSDAGRKVAIQSRGYKRKKSARNSELRTKNYETTGDEPFMLQENLSKVPVIAGEKRLSLAKSASEIFNLDTIILDDGYQHWRIFRDLDIVAIDATNPFGNGFLIPRGILREPLSALRRANIFFITHSDLAKENLNLLRERLTEINKDALIIDSVHSPEGFYNILDNQKKIIGIDLLKGKNLGLVTAIGNPASFETILLRMGIKISLKFIYLDHHEFTKNDFDNVISRCLQQGVRTLVTTQKDEVKLRQYCLNLKGIDILALRVRIKITENENLFFDRLFSLHRR